MLDPPKATGSTSFVGSDPSFDSDGNLVAAILGEAFGATRALWDRYAPLVTGIVRRALGPGYDVDDVVQDVFLRVFSHLHQLRDPNGLRSFVVSVTMNSVRQEFRQRKIRRWLHLTDSGIVPEMPGAWDPAPRLALARFYRILDDLNIEERTCFLMRHFEGLEQPEIAAALGLSVATMKRRLARATERVIRRVKQDPSLMEFMASPAFFKQEVVGHE